MCRGIWRQSAARFLARFSAGSGKLERRPAIKFCRNFERDGQGAQQSFGFAYQGAQVHASSY